MKFIEMTEGKEEILFEGTENEIINYWNTEKKALTDWITDNGTEDEILNRENVLNEGVEDISDLDTILSKIDYSWWTLRVE